MEKGMIDIKTIEKKTIDLDGVAKFLDPNEKYKGLSESLIYQCLHANERGDAEILALLMKNIIVFNLNEKKWYIYSNGVYTPDDIQSTRLECMNEIKRVYQFFTKMLKQKLADAILKKDVSEITFYKNTIEAINKKIFKLQSKSKIDNVLDLLGRDYLKCNSKQFDSDGSKINLLNGVYDFETHQLLQHDPKYLMKKQTGNNYDSNIYPEKWLEFLNTIFNNDADIIRFFQQLFGIWLTGNTDFQYLVFAFGSGANGKSTIFNIIQWLMNGEDPDKKGYPNTNGYFVKFDIQALLVQKTKNNTADQNMASLQGTRLAIASELPSKASLNENLVKDITGGDPIMARMLYGEPYSFYPTHNTIIFGNHKPIVKDASEGFWRRVLLLPFEVTIPENDRKPMSQIINELKPEFSGIFNWAVEGYKDYKENGLFIPDAVKIATEEYRSESNELLEFLEDSTDYIIKKENDDIKHELKEIFYEFAKWISEDESNRTTEIINTKKLGEAMRVLGFKVKKASKNKTYVFGITKKDLFNK